MAGKHRDLPGQFGEFFVQVDPQRPQVLVPAQGVAGADGRGAAGAAAADQDHARPGLADLHGGKDPADLARVEKKPCPPEFFKKGQAEGQRPEFLSRFQDGDLETPLQLPGAHGAAGAAADHDRPSHFPRPARR